MKEGEGDPSPPTRDGVYSPKTMKRLPAVTLSRITHLPGSAWSKAVENKSRFVSNADMAEDHTFDAYLRV